MKGNKANLYSMKIVLFLKFWKKFEKNVQRTQYFGHSELKRVKVNG